MKNLINICYPILLKRVHREKDDFEGKKVLYVEVMVKRFRDYRFVYLL